MFNIHLVDKFPDGFEQAPALEGVGEEVMGDPAHAANDLVQVAGRLVEDGFVLRVFDIDIADVELDGGKERAEAIMQIARDTFAFILPDGDLGEDLFSLKAHIAAVVADDGNEEINNDNCYDQSEKQRNIQDLILHL